MQQFFNKLLLWLAGVNFIRIIMVMILVSLVMKSVGSTHAAVLDHITAVAGR